MNAGQRLYIHHNPGARQSAFFMRRLGRRPLRLRMEIVFSLAKKRRLCDKMRQFRSLERVHANIEGISRFSEGREADVAFADHHHPSPFGHFHLRHRRKRRIALHLRRILIAQSSTRALSQAPPIFL
jgi:hypothetical protein